jgi:hypothetical protein
VVRRCRPPLPRTTGDRTSHRLAESAPIAQIHNVCRSPIQVPKVPPSTAPMGVVLSMIVRIVALIRLSLDSPVNLGFLGAANVKTPSDQEEWELSKLYQPGREGIS